MQDQTDSDPPPLTVFVEPETMRAGENRRRMDVENKSMREFATYSQFRAV
jgi:hypothetical protein